VTDAKAGEKAVKLSYEDKDGAHALEVDRLVVAVGRRANTEGLAPEAAGLEVDERAIHI